MARYWLLVVSGVVLVAAFSLLYAGHPVIAFWTLFVSWWTNNVWTEAEKIKSRARLNTITDTIKSMTAGIRPPGI